MAHLSGALLSIFHADDESAFEAEEAQLAAVRVWCALAAILVLAFGLIYHYIDPGAVDPLWVRLVLAGGLLVVLGFTFVNETAQRHHSHLYFGIIYFLFFWFLGLTAVNDFSPNYAFGLLFVFAALGIVHTLGIDRNWPLEWFLGIGVVFTLGVHLMVGQPGISPLLLSTYMFSLALVLYLALRVRVVTERSLGESETRNRAVLAQMSEGVFLADVQTLRFVESNPAFCKLTGFTEAELQQRTLFNVAVLARDVLRQGIEETRRTRRHRTVEVPFRRKDGRLVDVEVSANLITYAGREVICVIVRDIGERKQAEQALREAKEHAEETLRAKSGLLDNMSHELRTPLTGILGFAGVIAEEGNEEQREFARLIAKSGRRLMDTLEAVMRLADLESGGLEMKQEVVDLRRLVEQQVDAVAETADAKGLHLEVQGPAQVCARADASGVDHVLHHLIGNAVKFTEVGGVTVEVAAEERAAVIRVVDTGVGVAANFLPSLFDEFKQESRGLARSHEGTGLGLTITKRLVKIMGGEISVQSEKGEGSTFTVRLPRP